MARARVSWCTSARRRTFFLSALLAAAGSPTASAAANNKKASETARRRGTVSLLWPIHFSSVKLSGNADAFEPQEFADELRDIALTRFRQYLASTLPKELEIDPVFAKEFHGSDHSRVNLAFMSWQKRAFSLARGMPLAKLSSRGERLVMHDGISYSWPELYQSAAFTRFGERITELARLYMKRSGYENVKKRDLNIFIWAEVYAMGDALRPGAHPAAAYMMGRYFASGEPGSLKLNFEDPRGINPPYGKTYSHRVYGGNLVLYPTWASHFITPNMLNKTAVCYSFHVYPAAEEPLHWAGDKSSSLVVQLPLKLPPETEQPRRGGRRSR